MPTVIKGRGHLTLLIVLASFGVLIFAIGFGVLLGLTFTPRPPVRDAYPFPSSSDHVSNIGRMYDAMIWNQYTTTGATRRPLSDRDVRSPVLCGTAHVCPPDHQSPYRMEWRMTGFFKYDHDHPNDVPVGFLHATSDDPVDFEFSLAVLREFSENTCFFIPPEIVIPLIQEITLESAKLRPLGPGEYSYPMISSRIAKVSPTNKSPGEYAIRVDAVRFSGEADDRGSSIMVYFVYLPPGSNVDLSQVSGGGF